MSKTPEFDKKIFSELENLSPHEKPCRNKGISPHCEGDFKIYAEDIEFYKKFKIPPPTMCFHCRNQVRTAYIPNLLKFYKKEDSAEEGKKTISCFHPESEYKVFNNKYYFNPDTWDALDYGRDYDPQKPFLEQYHKLLLETPHYAIPRYSKNVVNSEYTVDSGEVKDCYMSATMGHCENVNYCLWAVYSRDCFDCLGVGSSEGCYENTVNNRCSNSYFLYQCFDSMDCTLCYDCRNCQDCFGCTNLRNRQYCFFNQQLTKEEYEKKTGEINLGNRDVLKEYQEKFWELKNRSLHLSAYRRKCENSLGHQLGNAKNCFYCFWGGDSENIRWSSDFMNMKDGMDLSIAGPGELGYNVADMWESADIKCCSFVGQSLDLEYCFECFDSKHCFGCVGLKKKQYCILNKQYTEEEYWKLVDEIKTNMLEAGEYGEFPSLSFALFPYRDTFAHANYPLSDSELKNLGGIDLPEPETENRGALPIESLEKDIKDTGDDILDKVFLCESSGKPFRFIRPELEYHRKHNMALPTKHPQVRLLERLKWRDPIRLWTRTCMCQGKHGVNGEGKGIYSNIAEHAHGDKPCGNEFQTSYNPERPEVVYCEECYKREVV